MRLSLCAVLLALAACHPAATTGRAVASDASSSAPLSIAPEPVARERASGLPPSADSGSPVPECSRDLDCAITRRLPNCCSACAPRALPVTARDSLEARCEGRDSACIQPLCRAPPTPPAALCVQGRCQLRPGRTDRR